MAHIPATHTDEVLAALFAAGAGAVGDYRECAFVLRGEGRFRPVDGAHPTIGTVGEAERVDLGPVGRVRFEPGEEREVTLVAFGGTGGRGVDGANSSTGTGTQLTDDEASADGATRAPQD